MSKLSILREFWDFCKVRKKYWMLPIIIVLALLIFMVVHTQAILPFLYP